MTEKNRNNKKEQNGAGGRRDFLKKSAAGFAGITFLPSLMKGSEKKGEATDKKDRKFIYRTLGRTGIKVPIISMGVMNADNPNLVGAALDAGIFHLDTAWYYQRGRNEEMIGKVVKGRPRDSYTVATKVYEPRDPETGDFPKSATAETFIAKAETSLKRLGLDYVDILYLHSAKNKGHVLFEPYLNALLKLKKEGKTRFIGVATHQKEPEVIRAAVDCKHYDVILTAYNFKQQHHMEIQKAIAYAAKAGLGIVGMKAIAGTVQDIGGSVKVNPKAALKWALQDKNVHTNIPGFTTFDQMETALSVMDDLTLTQAEKTELAESQKVAGLFCQQCRACISQCPAKMDIPTLMRSYMYAHGYKNRTAARLELDEMNLENLPCLSCGNCKVSCAMGFQVRDKILDISRLKDVPEEFLA